MNQGASRTLKAIMPERRSACIKHFLSGNKGYSAEAEDCMPSMDSPLIIPLKKFALRAMGGLEHHERRSSKPNGCGRTSGPVAYPVERSTGHPRRQTLPS